MYESIGILHCVYNRIENLHYTMNMLNQQNSDNFTIYVINNNPEMFNQVEGICSHFDNYEIIHNNINRGPFARIEEGHKLSFFHEYFLFLDDDMKFDETLISQWINSIDYEKPLQGYRGFNFLPNRTYWGREQVFGNNKQVDYLQGQCLLVESSVLGDKQVLNILDDSAKMFSDDLHLCWYVDYILESPIYVKHIRNLECVVDGKDSYVRHAQDKINFLNLLREEGWDV